MDHSKCKRDNDNRSAHLHSDLSPSVIATNPVSSVATSNEYGP